MLDKIPCEGCVIDSICVYICDEFQIYIDDRLLGISYIPEEFIKTETRYKRSLSAHDSVNTRWFRLHIARELYVESH